MFPEQRVAFIQSQIICAMAEMEAMKIENLGEVKRWSADDFRAVPDRFGLGHNAVIGYLMEGQ